MRNIDCCNLCNNSDFELFLTKDSYNIVKCTNCNLICLDLRLDVKESKKIYTESYFQNSNGMWITKGYPDYLEMEDIFRKVTQKKIKKIRRYFNKGYLLDIGCATGFFLDEAKQYFDVVGIEISKFAAEYSRNEFMLEIFDTPLEECEFESNQFDVITLWDTIEHLDKPKQTLLEVKRILKNSSLLVLQTGNVDSIMAKLSGKRWHLYTPPEHLYYFSKKTLENLLTKTGFFIKEINYEWSYFSMAFLFDRLYRMILLSKKYVNKIGMLNKIWLPFNLFDIITVYAIKK